MFPSINKEHHIPLSIILASLIISFSILLSSGVITLKNVKSGLVAQNLGTTIQPTTPNTLGAQATPPPTQVNVSLGHIPALGSANAKVAVVEWADLRCPFCEKFFTDSEPQLLKDYVNTGKVKFTFRHFEFLGPSSIVAGNGAECANEQGKFWDFYNYMYKNQPDESDTSMYTTDKLTTIATNLGMNGSQFNSCLSANKFADNVTKDQNDGQQAGVNGTPSFVIGKLDASGNNIVNGTLIVGAVPYATLKTSIDSALQ